ncbi:MAG: carbonate dehydratase [Rhodocyclaceae bacterium]
MRKLPELFENNRRWAQRILAEDPRFFVNLAAQQSPNYLWIGCSDSRVPANQITGLAPGEVFVHRNVANVVAHTDLNCLSVMQFAVDVLKVSHIMVVGHYGCSGVKVALLHQRVGLADNWLRYIHDVIQKHQVFLDRIADPEARLDRLCEINAVEQVMNVCQTTIVRDAWQRGQALTIHGWVYGLRDGLLRDLGICISGREEEGEAYRQAIKLIAETAR